MSQQGHTTRFTSAPVWYHRRRARCRTTVIHSLAPYLRSSCGALQMGMSPSRMPQAQGMMAAHGGGSMVGQTAGQGPFLAQKQFPPGSTTGALNVPGGPGMGQPQAQAAVTQVKEPTQRHGGMCCRTNAVQRGVAIPLASFFFVEPEVVFCVR